MGLSDNKSHTEVSVHKIYSEVSVEILVFYHSMIEPFKTLDNQLDPTRKSLQKLLMANMEVVCG